MDKDPIKTVARRATRKRRLPDDAVCIHCGQEELECLKAKKLLEEHHVLGVAHDAEVTVALCRNCHAIYSDDQIREGVQLQPQANLIETAIAMLQGLAAFFRRLVDGFERMIEMLQTGVLRLDASHPDWRESCTIQK